MLYFIFNLIYLYGSSEWFFVNFLNFFNLNIYYFNNFIMYTFM